MAGNSSSLTFKLFGKDVSASKVFSLLEKRADTTDRKVRGIGTGAIAVGSMLGSLGATGVMALAGVAESAISTGVQTAAAMEQAQVGFTTLTGSAQNAQKFIAKLSAFAAATPFELPGLVESSRTLMGVGVSADEVIPMLTAFGDAAGAVGIGQEEFQRIMLATSQAISAGKFQTADLNQIMNNGLPVWSILSKAMGKPVSTLRDMAAKGKLLSKDVLPILQKQMEKDYGGSMAKQSQTLAGIWSTLQDTFSQGMAQVLVPMLPMLKNLATQGIGLLSKAFAWLAQQGPTVANALGTVGNFVSTVLWPILQKAWGWISTVAIPTIQMLAASFMQNVWPAIQTVAGMIAQNLQPAIEALGAYWSDTLYPAIQRMIPVFAVIAKVIGIVIGAVLLLVSWLIGKLIPGILKVIGVFTTFATSLMSKVGSAITWVIDNFGKIVEYAKGIPAKLVLAFAGLVTIITAPFRAAFNGIASLWNNTVGKLSFHVPDWVPGMGGKGFDVPDIPMLAAGGIVTRPTLALIGERGPEAVIPLNRHNAGGVIIYITQPLGTPEQIGRAVADAQRRGKSSGRVNIKYA